MRKVSITAQMTSFIVRCKWQRNFNLFSFPVALKTVTFLSNVECWCNFGSHHIGTRGMKLKNLQRSQKRVATTSLRELLCNGVSTEFHNTLINYVYWSAQLIKFVLFVKWWFFKTRTLSPSIHLRQIFEHKNYQRGADQPTPYLLNSLMRFLQARARIPSNPSESSRMIVYNKLNAIVFIVDVKLYFP